MRATLRYQAAARSVRSRGKVQRTVVSKCYSVISLVRDGWGEEDVELA